ARRSRCQLRSLGERSGSLTADLLADVGRVQSGEELAEEFLELLLSVGRQMSPHRRRVGRLQARGGVGRRGGAGLGVLRWEPPGVAGTTRPARATPLRR